MELFNNSTIFESVEILCEIINIFKILIQIQKYEGFIFKT